MTHFALRLALASSIFALLPVAFGQIQGSGSAFENDVSTMRRLGIRSMWRVTLLRIQGSVPQFDDHASLMQKLGIKSLRRGPDPNNQSTFSESIANPYASSLPDLLTMNDGRKVTRADQW